MTSSDHSVRGKKIFPPLDIIGCIMMSSVLAICFILLSSRYMYKQIDKITTTIGFKIINADGYPTNTGVFVNSILFFIICFLMLYL